MSVNLNLLKKSCTVFEKDIFAKYDVAVVIIRLIEGKLLNLITYHQPICKFKRQED